MHDHWRHWIGSIWHELTKGRRLTVPAFLHLEQSGLCLSKMAEPVGQVRDWVFPWPDGSRIHVHEMPDGTCCIHRDRFDPAQGVVRAVAHVAFESHYCHVILVVVGSLAGSLACWKLLIK